MEIIERELRFIIPARRIDISQSVNSISIKEIHFRTDAVGIRIRYFVRDKKELYELTFKFRKPDYSLEHTIPIPKEQGERLFANSRDFGLPEVTKTRYIFGVVRPFWEVDIYQDNLGYLAIAEMEYDGLKYPSIVVQKPTWYIGENWNVEEMDVTKDWEFLKRILSTDKADLSEFNKEMHSRLQKIEFTG